MSSWRFSSLSNCRVPGLCFLMSGVLSLWAAKQTDHCSQSMALCRAVTGEINAYCSVQMLPEESGIVYMLSAHSDKSTGWSWGSVLEALEIKLSHQRFITLAWENNRSKYHHNCKELKDLWAPDTVIHCGGMYLPNFRTEGRILEGKDDTIPLQNCCGIVKVPLEQTGTWCFQPHVKGMKKIPSLRSLQTG